MEYRKNGEDAIVLTAENFPETGNNSSDSGSLTNPKKKRDRCLRERTGVGRGSGEREGRGGEKTDTEEEEIIKGS